MALVVKNMPANAGDRRDSGSIPGWGRSPGGGHGNPLQYSFLENLMDRGAWQATQSIRSQRVRTEEVEHPRRSWGKIKLGRVMWKGVQSERKNDLRGSEKGTPQLSSKS